MGFERNFGSGKSTKVPPPLLQNTQKEVQIFELEAPLLELEKPEIFYQVGKILIEIFSKWIKNYEIAEFF